MTSNTVSTAKVLAIATDRTTNPSKWVWPLVLVAIALFVVRPSIYANNSELPAPADGADAHPVRVVAAKVNDQAPVVRLPAVLRGRERGALAFLHSGQLAERRVELGQSVEAGDVLAVLHNPALMPGAEAAAARNREAQFNFDQLEREVERLTDLERRDLVPTEELERIVARRDAAGEALKQSEAALNEAREQLDEAMLRAPYPGIVSDLMVEPGQFVSAGQSILSLVGSSGLEAAVHLPVNRAARLQIGRTVQIKAPDGLVQPDGTIREISVSGPGQAVEVVIDIENSEPEMLRSGQAVDVTLPLDNDAKISVPMSAITQSSSGLAQVFRVENRRALAVDVRPGRMQGGWIEVDGNLAEGDLVVIAGHGRLLDDDPVRVLQ